MNTKMTRYVVIACLLAVVAIPAAAQDREAPNISGMAVQGVTVNLELPIEVDPTPDRARGPQYLVDGVEIQQGSPTSPTERLR